jgi:hypothetical protein
LPDFEAYVRHAVALAVTVPASQIEPKESIA